MKKPFRTLYFGLIFSAFGTGCSMQLTFGFQVTQRNDLDVLDELAGRHPPPAPRRPGLSTRGGGT